MNRDPFATTSDLIEMLTTTLNWKTSECMRYLEGFTHETSSARIRIQTNVENGKRPNSFGEYLFVTDITQFDRFEKTVKKDDETTTDFYRRQLNEFIAFSCDHSDVFPKNRVYRIVPMKFDRHNKCILEDGTIQLKFVDQW